MKKTVARTSLCKETKRDIEFLEKKYNCLIILLRDDNKHYMSVFNLSDNTVTDDIELCDINVSKDRFYLSVRKWFKENR